MNEEKLDRIALKQQRKERKQLKKEAKRIEQQKEHEKKYLEIKFSPKDQRVKLISSNINNSLNLYPTSPQFNIKNINNNFPSLEQTSHIKNKYAIKQNTVLPESQTNEKISTKHKKSTPLILNITEILSTPSISNSKECLEKSKKIPTTQRNRNILDASQPVRLLRGKHRAIPKQKQASKLKTQIILDSKISDPVRNPYNGIHSANFETYCDHIVTDDLNICVKNCLSDIVRFQEHLYKSDPIRGNAKRRYIVGLREVKRFVVIRKLKLVVIAPDIRTVIENGALDTAVHDLIASAKQNEIPYVFALSRWKLGEITLKCRPISCVGIFDYSGAEEKYDELIKLSTNERIAYENLFPTNEDILSQDDKTQEIVEKIVNICTS